MQTFWTDSADEKDESSKEGNVPRDGKVWFGPVLSLSDFGEPTVQEAKFRHLENQKHKFTTVPS